jgi:hypothetical protein
VPLVIGSLLVAMAFTIFLSPAIGVPLLVLAVIFGAIGWFGGNRTDTGRMQELREQASPGIEFSARDRETLTPAETDSAR